MGVPKAISLYIDQMIDEMIWWYPAWPISVPEFIELRSRGLAKIGPTGKVLVKVQKPNYKIKVQKPVSNVPKNRGKNR